MDELKAVNKMLAAISQQPVSTLQGSLSSRVILARNILEDTIENEQMTGYYFNTEDDYPFYAAQDGTITVAETFLKIDTEETDEFVQQGQKLYNKTQHTYNIGRTIRARVVRRLNFEELPPIAQRYIVMVAANDFVAKVKQSRELYAYSSQAVAEAKAKLEQAEIDTGNFNILSTYDLRRSI